MHCTTSLPVVPANQIPKEASKYPLIYTFSILTQQQGEHWP